MNTSNSRRRAQISKMRKRSIAELDSTEIKQICVPYKTVGNPEVKIQILMSFISYLLYIRGQIPRQIEEIRRLVSPNQQQVLIKRNERTSVSESNNVKPRKAVEKPEPARLGTSREMLSKESCIQRVETLQKPDMKLLRQKRRAANFLRNFTPLCNVLRVGMEQESFSQVLLLFGASLQNPKEVFLLNLPQTKGDVEQISEKLKLVVRQKLILNMFRNFSLLSEKRTHLCRIHILANLAHGNRDRKIPGFLPKRCFSLENLQLNRKAIPVHIVTISSAHSTSSTGKGPDQIIKTADVTANDKISTQNWFYFPKVIKVWLADDSGHVVALHGWSAEVLQAEIGHAVCIVASISVHLIEVDCKVMAYHTVVRNGKDSHRIFYRCYGNPDSQEKILFTMGLGGDHFQWEPQIEYFKTLKDCQICVYDNRGMGFSEPVWGRWTTKGMAQDALSLLNFLGWQTNVHLVGLSMGGMVSQELALLDLSRFRSMTLISTFPGGLFSLALMASSIPSGVRTLIAIFTASTPKDQLKSGLRILYPDSFLEEISFNEKRGEHEPNYRKFKRALIERGVKTRQEGMPRIRFMSILKQALAVMTHKISNKSLAKLSSHFQGNSLVITGDEDIFTIHGTV